MPQTAPVKPKTPTRTPNPIRRRRPGTKPNPKGSTTTAPAPVKPKTPTRTPNPIRRRRPGTKPNPKGRIVRKLIKGFFDRRKKVEPANEANNFLDYFKRKLGIVNEDIDTLGFPDYISNNLKNILKENGVGVEDLLPLNNDEIKYLETIASESYVNAIKNFEKAFGFQFSGNLPGIMGSIQQSLMSIERIENRNTDKILNLAVDSVLSLPEFEKIKEMVDSGEVKIEMELRGLNNNIAQEYEESQSDVSEMEELDLEMYNELDDQIKRRKFTNMLIQGNAQSKQKLYYMIKDEIDEIDDDLIKMYDKLFPFIDLLYFTMFESQNDPQAMIGMEVVDEDEGEDGEDVVTIKVRGINLPVLIHELVKGIMEFIHMGNIPEDPTLAKHVISKADTLDNEKFGLTMGERIENKIRQYFDRDTIKYLPRVQQLITQLPQSQIQDILSLNNKGKNIVKRLIDQAEDEYRDYDIDQLGDQY